ncbi:hypothetical protein LCGC14_2228430 [marine sediment metagenome]|uniref:Uncharacterized protein n=1 Tax=marine sediment metagenome TaxID=412755 RepID=A0A0F9G480_9ZZZZ
MPCLDLRDLAKELEELTDQEEDEDAEPLDEDERDRLEALRQLEADFGPGSGSIARQAENESTMIPEDEFEGYAQDLADSLGYTGSSDENPLYAYIDWERWAEDLKADYTEVEYDGDTYLLRAY